VRAATTRRAAASASGSRGEDRAHVLHRGISLGESFSGSCCCARRDDLRVEARELLGEREIGVGERVDARAVVQVAREHAPSCKSAPTSADPRQPLAQDPEALAVACAQAQRAARGDAPAIRRRAAASSRLALMPTATPRELAAGLRHEHQRSASRRHAIRSRHGTNSRRCRP